MLDNSELLRRYAQQRDELASTEPGPVWAELRPLLNEAMSELAATDRDAVLLRKSKIVRPS